MRFRRIETYLILGCYLAVGAFLGYSISKEKPAIKPNTVTVDVVKEGDEILIYEHYSGELVFEYNKNKGVDKTAYKEFERQLKEENLTKNRLARKLGISRARITQLLNLLKLPQEKLDYILKYGQEKGITERSLRKEASHIIEPEENQNEI